MNYFVKLIINIEHAKLLYGFCARTERNRYHWYEKRTDINNIKIYTAILSKEDKDELIESLTDLSPYIINNLSLSFCLEKGANSITTAIDHCPVGNSYSLTEYWQKDKSELIKIIESDSSNRIKQQENRKQAFNLIKKETGINLLINTDRLGNFEEYEPLRFCDAIKVSSYDKTVTISKTRPITENLTVCCENRIAGRLVNSFLKTFERDIEQICFDFNEVVSEITIKAWAENGELVYITNNQLILKIGMNFNLVQNRTLNDRWSKKLEKSSIELNNDIDRVKNFQISFPDSKPSIIDKRPIWIRYYDKGKQIENSFRQSQTKGCFVWKVASKKGEIDSFFKIKEYIEEPTVKKVIIADPFFSVVSSEKFMGRISNSNVEILIITSLSGIDPDTGNQTDILSQYKKHLRLNANILHRKTEIYNVTHNNNQAFHDRYLIRYFEDNTIDGFMLSNSLNSAGQKYSFVVAPLEKEVCFSVEEYLNNLIDYEYQNQQNKFEKLSIEKIFPINNSTNNNTPTKNELLFPTFISEEKEAEIALKYSADKGFVNRSDDNERYTTRKDNWGLIIDAVFSKWDESPQSAAYALGDALYHSVLDCEPYKLIAKNPDYSDKLITEITRLAPTVEEQQNHKLKNTDSEDYKLWAILNGKAKPSSMFRLPFTDYRVSYQGKDVVVKYLYEFLLYKDSSAFMKLLSKTSSPLMLSLLYFKVGTEKFNKTLYNHLINSRWDFLHELGAKWLYDTSDRELITNTISSLKDEKALEQATYLLSEVNFTISKPNSDLTKWAQIDFFLQSAVTQICNQKDLSEDIVLKHLDKLNNPADFADANLKIQIARHLTNEKHKSFLYKKAIKRYESRINRTYSPPYNKDKDESYLELILESLTFSSDECDKRIVRLLHWDLLNYYCEPYVNQYNPHLWQEAESKISWDIALLELYKQDNDFSEKLDYFYQTSTQN